MARFFAFSHDSVFRGGSCARGAGICEGDVMPPLALEPFAASLALEPFAASLALEPLVASRSRTRASSAAARRSAATILCRGVMVEASQGYLAHNNPTCAHNLCYALLPSAAEGPKEIQRVSEEEGGGEEKEKSE